MSPPIVQSSTFAFRSPEEMLGVSEGRIPGWFYTRYDNPTVRAVEEKLAGLEGAERALLFSSGVAATHAVLWSLAPQGGRLLAGRDLYGGTIDLLGDILPRIGVAREHVDPGDPSALEGALARRPAVFLFETPTNPLARVLDGPVLVDKARAAGCRVVVDNTFATPILQNPISWGADIVIHSATKYLGGHSDLVLGVAIGSEKELEPIARARRVLGACADPFAAWLLNRGLATLALRVRAQSATALRLARGLASRGDLRAVHYPGLENDPGHAIASRQMRGFGGIVSLDLPGERKGAMAFLGGLRLFRLATSLGGVESLASHPATSSHRMLSDEERARGGVGEGLVRLSIGLEDPEDLEEDLLAALEAAGSPRS